MKTGNLTIRVFCSFPQLATFNKWDALVSRFSNILGSISHLVESNNLAGWPEYLCVLNTNSSTVVVSSFSLYVSKCWHHVTQRRWSWGSSTSWPVKNLAELADRPTMCTQMARAGETLLNIILMHKRLASSLLLKHFTGQKYFATIVSTYKPTFRHNPDSGSPTKTFVCISHLAHVTSPPISPFFMYHSNKKCWV